MNIRSGLRAAVMSCVLAATGCTYLETQLQRQAPPDTRIQLEWHERRFLYAREIPNYTCSGAYRLQCEGGTSVTYSCTCVLR